MTPKRAKEIIAEAQQQAKFGPWVDQIDLVLRKGEAEEIGHVWTGMPDSASFLDALLRIAGMEQ